MRLFKQGEFKLDFIIVGVQKAGTSALDQYLRQHPQIQMANQKELHFFDDDKRFREPKVDYSFIASFFPQKAKGCRYGESTPIYIYWKPAMERIKKYNSKIKILLVLRNPVERAFSNWNMEVFKGRETRGFLTSIQHEISLINSNKKEQHRYKSYVERGLYSEQIKNLLSLFEKEQILFIKYEDFVQKQRETVREIFSFLGVADEKNIFAKVISNKIDYIFSLKSEEKKILEDFFYEDVLEVESLLGWNCNDWKSDGYNKTFVSTKKQF